MSRLLLLAAAALLAAALTGGSGRSEAAFTATAGNSATSFATAAVFNAVAVSLADPGSPLTGTATLTATATSDRPIVSVRFQSSPAGAGTWTDHCTDTVAPYECDWDTAGVASGSYDLRAVALDGSGYSQTSTVADRFVDSTAPAVGLTDPGTPLTGSRTLSATAIDTGGTGVASVAFAYRASPSGAWTEICSDSASPYSCSWSTAALPDGSYDLRATATDNAGNAASSTVPARRVDNTAPSVAVVDDGRPKSGTIAAHVATDDGDGSGVDSVLYQYRPSGAGAWYDACTAGDAPFSCTVDTTHVPDGSYDIRAVATDGAGFQTTSAPVTVQVDNTDPAGVGMTNPGASLSGTVSLSGTAADTGSGIASVRFQYAPAGSSSWADACSDASFPYACGWDTTAIADGLYDLRALATDRAGNETASATIASRRVDNLAPAVALADPGSPLGGAPTLTATASDGGGIASVVFQRKLSSSGAWTTMCTDTGAPWTCAWDTTALADGTYDLRATATDNAGRTATSTVTGRVVDNGPRASSVSSTSGGSSGRLSFGDYFTMTYDEAPLASSLIAGWSGASRAVTIVFTRSGSTTGVAVTDTATGAAVPIGTLTLGDRFTQTTSATFGGTLLRSGWALRLTLSGSPTSGSVRTGAAPVAITWTNAAAVTDAAGNPGRATTVTASDSF